MDLEEPWVFGMWPRRLLIFEDRLEVRDFELFRERILSRGYGRIDGAVVSGAGWFANLLVTVRGSEPILMRGLSKGVAERARALIEARTTQPDCRLQAPPLGSDTKRLVHALADLRDAGVLSEEEFEAKRAEVTAREE
jgi:hypothetical protein